MKKIALIAVALPLAGCAHSSSDISATYVSPMTYRDYSCAQLAEEAQAIGHHVAEVSGAQDSQRTSDAVATTAAVIIFWPAAFMVGGDRQTAAELARLKGEADAIEQASIAKKCGIRFEHG